MICFVTVCSLSLSSQTKIDSVAGKYDEYKSPYSDAWVPSVTFQPTFTVITTDSGTIVHSPPPGTNYKCIVTQLPYKLVRTINLAKNKCASITTHMAFVSIHTTEYGKWRMQGDTVIITLSKLESSLQLYYPNGAKPEKIQKMEKPEVRKFLWEEGWLKDLSDENSKDLSKRETDLQ